MMNYKGSGRNCCSLIDLMSLRLFGGTEVKGTDKTALCMPWRHMGGLEVYSRQRSQQKVIELSASRPGRFIRRIPLSKKMDGSQSRCVRFGEEAYISRAPARNCTTIARFSSTAPGHYTDQGGQKRIPKNRSQDSHCFGRDSNNAPKFKCWVLQQLLRCGCQTVVFKGSDWARFNRRPLTAFSLRPVHV